MTMSSLFGANIATQGDARDWFLKRRAGLDAFLQQHTSTSCAPRRGCASGIRNVLMGGVTRCDREKFIVEALCEMRAASDIHGRGDGMVTGWSNPSTLLIHAKAHKLVPSDFGSKSFDLVELHLFILFFFHHSFSFLSFVTPQE